MPDLNFEMLSAKVKPFAAVPTLVFNLQVSNQIAGEEVYAAGLKCQVIIEATKRQYSAEDKENLREVFGEPKRWEETVKGLYWTTVTVPVPRFTGKTEIEVEIGCCEDHIAAAGKYFYSVKEGDIPLAFLFSGTLFYKGENEQLQITQISWEKEAAFKMSGGLWQEMMDTYFPNSRWITLRNDIFDKLYQYKASHSFATLEQCIETLIEESLQNTEEKQFT